jgi:hypothetical protein
MTDKQKEQKELEKQESKEVGYLGSLFASVSFPARTPKKQYWSRTNGRDTLIIRAGLAEKIRRKKIIRDENGNAEFEALKVPAGITPRHIMLYFSWVWTVKRQHGDQSKVINLGNSLNEFLRRINAIDPVKGGNQYDLLLRQVHRLFNCEIGAIRESDQGYQKQHPKPILDEQTIWWSDIDPDQRTILPSTVTISDSLAAILEKSFPLNLETVRSIGRNVLAFDLYNWLTLRHYSVTRPVTVTFEALHQQFGADYKEARDFKIRLKKAFDLVGKHYKHNSVLTDHGIQLRRSKPDIDPTNLSSEASRQYLIDLGISKPV